MKKITTKKQLEALGFYVSVKGNGFWIQNKIAKVFVPKGCELIDILETFYNEGKNCGEENGAWNKQQEIKNALGIID